MKQSKPSKNKLDKSKYGYFFIAPFFVVFLVFSLYPIVYTFVLSFQKWDGFIPPQPNGIENFKRLISDDAFYLALWNTLRMWMFNFVPQIGMALLLAGVFTLNKIKGMSIFRAVFYLPNLITAASVGLLFSLVFNGDKSAANYILMNIGLIKEPISFLESTLFASGAVSYIQWWMWFGYTTIIVMAGMTSIDKFSYEAAMVDGANKFQIFTRISIPLIRPTLIYLMITSVIGGMQLFDVPSTLTDGLGSPQKSILSISMYIYNQGFRNQNLSYASTLSVGLFLITAVLCAVGFRFMDNGGGEDHG